MEWAHPYQVGCRQQSFGRFRKREQADSVSKKSNRSKLYLEAASSAGGSSRSELPSKEAAFAVAETSIRQLMAKGRHKSALDRAKELHKAQGTAASEALLLGAYRVRIQDLMQQNLTAEATALLDLVRERSRAREPANWKNW
jgi:hypothetical protein